MTFFEAVAEKQFLLRQGFPAVHAEVTDQSGFRYQVVFRCADELREYRKFNQDWAIKIKEIV